MGREGNGTKGIEQRLLAVPGSYSDKWEALPTRLCDLMPVVPSLQRGIWAVEPAEEFYPASLEVWQGISLTSRLVEYPSAADMELLGEFIGG
jgi:hypothetical protein